ncbi:SGNH/GDSL hydrolase family protein [Chloroflexi bacterium TSY]|nr:SGNH/GDSL hydrolase family protein [Chloroflexi bacterium TSY]
MIRFIQFGLGSILVPFVVSACYSDAAADNMCPSPCHILPLGDSITQGELAWGSYRSDLLALLVNDGYNVDFVGSHTKHVNGEPVGPDYDVDHEGHWGWRVDEIIDGRESDDGSGTGRLVEWLVEYTPDIVLLHLGTNDMFAQDSVENTVRELEQVIDILRDDNANVTILLAKLIPVNVQFAQESIDALNNEMDGIAARKNRDRSPVIVVDQSDGFDAEIDTYDDVHPNESGRLKMAQKWMAALEPFLTKKSAPNLEVNKYRAGR